MTHDEDLGMHRPIHRRDFLQGMALGAACLASACVTGSTKKTNGSNSQSFKSNPQFGGQSLQAKTLGHSVRGANPLSSEVHAIDTGELYDLVVVGAGISGMTAAMVYQNERKHQAKILILDNNSEFGGHASRNSFQHEGQDYIASGGTYALEYPYASPQEALAVFRQLGVDFEEMLQYHSEDYTRLGLSSCLLFDPRHFKTDRVQWLRNFHTSQPAQFFANAPLRSEEKEELIELYTTRKNYLAEHPNAHDILRTTPWEEYIRKFMKLGDLAVMFANLYATDLFGLGCDSVAASHALEVGPGFLGMGGSGFSERNGVVTYNYETHFRFPDGNHTIARALANQLVPSAFAKAKKPEDLFLSPIDTAQLQSAEHNVQFRFNAMATSLRHNAENGVDIVYRHANGSLHKVKTKSAIMSGWGMVSKHIVPELAEEQKSALQGYRYTSAAYINVFLRNWRPIAEIGADKMFLPNGYCTWMSILDPLTVGAYKPRYDPGSPTVLSMYKYFYSPGVDAKTQMTMGRIELERKTFEDFEREIRFELNHIFGAWGFDAGRDILGIQINRWGHGYNFFKGPTASAEPYEQGRQSLGRISFAGADAGGSPWMQSGMQQGWRAAHEQLQYT